MEAANYGGSLGPTWQLEEELFEWLGQLALQKSGRSTGHRCLDQLVARHSPLPFRTAPVASERHPSSDHDPSLRLRTTDKGETETVDKNMQTGQ